MFERYTEPARRVIFFGRHEALESGSGYITTEHLLLGVLREDHALALRLLGSEEKIAALRAQVSSPKPSTRTSASVDLPLNHEAKRVLAYGAEEALRLSHRHIGAEHLLLGILREKNSQAAQALRSAGIELTQLRELFADLEADVPAELKAAQNAKEQLHHLIDELPPELWKPAEEALRAIRRATPAKAPGAGPDVFERYTGQARRTIFMARYEASRFGAKAIESEHLLLGLVREHRRLTDRLFDTGTRPWEIQKKSSSAGRPARKSCPRQWIFR